MKNSQAPARLCPKGLLHAAVDNCIARCETIVRIRAPALAVMLSSSAELEQWTTLTIILTERHEYTETIINE